MTDPREPNVPRAYERLLDLLALRATEGLPPEQAAELERLLREHPGEDVEGLDRAAAALDLAMGLPYAGPLPQHLAERVLREGLQDAARRRAAPGARPAPWRRGVIWGAAGWVLAASLLVALGMRWGWPAARATPADRRATLLAEAPDVIRLGWSPPKAAEFAKVRGDVVWSDARQEGYLRLVGMPANDPRLSEYQLWIVDPGRDRHPVDGGVFDVPAGANEVVIPITAKLPVRRPGVFAITREQPGGVVVSRGPLLVVAAR
jgi:hypothetical protein